MSVANNTCTQTCQTSLTTFPDVNLITSSSFTVQLLLPRQRADLIAFSRFWLVYLAADWQVVGFNTAGVGADFLCTRLSEGFVAFDFMFPPLPLLLENPTYFSARQEEIKEDFRCQFRVQTPTRIHDSSQNDIRRFQYIFDIFQRATRLPPPLYVSCSLLQNTTWPPNERNCSCCWFLKFVGCFIGFWRQGRDWIDKKNQSREIETTLTARRRCWKQTK